MFTIDAQHANMFTIDALDRQSLTLYFPTFIKMLLKSLFITMVHPCLIDFQRTLRLCPQRSDSRLFPLSILRLFLEHF